jgi:hypothetical protein
MSQLRVYYSNCKRCGKRYREVEGDRDLLCEECRELWYKCIDKHGLELRKVDGSEHKKLLEKIWQEFLTRGKVKVKFD